MIYECQGENNYWILNRDDVNGFPKDWVFIIVVGPNPQEPLKKTKKV